jgi:hypothetical protein
MQKLNHTRHSLLNVDLQIEKNINYICSLEKLIQVINASRFAKWKIEITTIEYFVTFMAKWSSTTSMTYVIFVIHLHNSEPLKTFQHSEKITTIEHSTPNGNGYF